MLTCKECGCEIHRHPKMTGRMPFYCQPCRDEHEKKRAKARWQAQRKPGSRTSGNPHTDKAVIPHDEYNEIIALAYQNGVSMFGIDDLIGKHRGYTRGINTRMQVQSVVKIDPEALKNLRELKNNLLSKQETV